MDIFSIVGLVVGFGMVVFGIIVDMKDGFAIMMDNIGAFIDIQSILIVIGGTIGALMISFSMKQFFQIIKHLKIIFLPPKYNPEKYIKQIVEFATKARINGLLALEEDLEKVKDQFMKNSLMMVVDSVEPEKVKQHLETQLEYLDDRHAQARALYDRGSAYAPAFGMIGTLIGLINMLKGLNMDGGGGSSSLGEDMSVALITTFYGCLLANLIFNPIASKLRIRHQEEELYCSLVIEGVLAIQAGENPKFLREHLLATLKQSQQKKLLAKAGASAGSAAAGGEE